MPLSLVCGRRSMVSITRWKRSRSFSAVMSKAVVMVPSLPIRRPPGLPRLGPQYHLDAIVLFAVEHAVAFGGRAEIHSMRNRESRIDLTLLDQIHQPAHVFMYTGPAHFEGERLGERRAHGEFIQKSGVESRYRDRTALAARLNGLAQRIGLVGRQRHLEFHLIDQGRQRGSVRFESHGVDAGVRAAPAGHLL